MTSAVSKATAVHRRRIACEGAHDPDEKHCQRGPTLLYPVLQKGRRIAVIVVVIHGYLIE